MCVCDLELQSWLYAKKKKSVYTALDTNLPSEL